MTTTATTNDDDQRRRPTSNTKERVGQGRRRGHGLETCLSRAHGTFFFLFLIYSTNIYLKLHNLRVGPTPRQTRREGQARDATTKTGTNDNTTWVLKGGDDKNGPVVWVLGTFV
jgi:hypothetical protein